MRVVGKPSKLFIDAQRHYNEMNRPDYFKGRSGTVPGVA